MTAALCSHLAISAPMLKIRTYTPGDREAFDRLNRAWLEEYFAVEAIDEAIFADPEGMILAKGGAIFVAESEEGVCGVCAMMLSEGGQGQAYEFSKMGVDVHLRGHGIGRKLGQAAIDWAEGQGATKIILYSNRRLAPALHLYRSLGFAEVPFSEACAERYQRCDIRLEKTLGGN